MAERSLGIALSGSMKELALIDLLCFAFHLILILILINECRLNILVAHG